MNFCKGRKYHVRIRNYVDSPLEVPAYPPAGLHKPHARINGDGTQSHRRPFTRRDTSNKNNTTTGGNRRLF